MLFASSYIHAKRYFIYVQYALIWGKNENNTYVAYAILISVVACLGSCVNYSLIHSPTLISVQKSAMMLHFVQN